MEKTRLRNPKSAVASPEKLLVVAIDFGTTFSGYAFAFRSDYIQDPLDIKGNQWNMGSEAGVSLKTSTSVLFDTKGEFAAFGTEAEDRYTELALNEKHQDWYFFRQFKMILYNNQAGICNNLLIALEPEAASIYCQHLPVAKREGNRMNLDSFYPGIKYLVLDAGGGTIDITVQEVQAGGRLREVYKANGGNWGGTRVDEAFMEFLRDVVGEDVMTRFRSECRADYVSLCRDFEIKKRTIKPEMDGKITFKIPISIIELYEKINGKSLKENSEGSKYGSRVVLIGDKLRIDSEIAKDLFKATCDSIVKHVDMIFQQPEVTNTETILMVGGFSESPMLRSAVIGKFPDKKVIIPNESGLSVLKGAVLFGFNSRVIASRICKYTYGICVQCDFRPGIDPEEKKVMVEGRLLCENRFSKHVSVGQSIAIDEATPEKTYRPSEPDQTEVVLKVYVTESLDPEYVDDEGCKYLGSLTVDMPDITEGLKRVVGVQMTFGGTELTVQARNGNTKEITSATLDFLNHEI